MADNSQNYYRFDRPRSFEVAAAWVITVLVVIDFLFLGFVAWNAWRVDKESERPAVVYRRRGYDYGVISHEVD